MNKVEKFYKIIKQRSIENRKSFSELYKNKCYGTCVSILRQELDSYVRVMFLDGHSKKNIFINQTLEGVKWKDNKQIITDRYMLDSVEIKSQGWEKFVYKLGCSFIHLSHFHNYVAENPFHTLSKKDKESIVSFVKQYHGIDININDLKTIIPILPLVMEKIHDNLQYALEQEL